MCAKAAWKRCFEPGGVRADYGNSPEGLELVVRTKLAPEVLASSVMGTLRQINPSQPATEFRPLTLLVDHAVSPRRFFVLLVAVFAMLGLILASRGHLWRDLFIQLRNGRRRSAFARPPGRTMGESAAECAGQDDACSTCWWELGWGRCCRLWRRG